LEVDDSETRRVLKYLAQKVRRYVDAGIAPDKKGLLHAKFNMFGALQEAEEFLYQSRSRREKWLHRLKAMFRGREHELPRHRGGESPKRKAGSP
jgi:hypothetical protein